MSSVYKRLQKRKDRVTLGKVENEISTLFITYNVVKPHSQDSTIHSRQNAVMHWFDASSTFIANAIINPLEWLGLHCN